MLLYLLFQYLHLSVEGICENLDAGLTTIELAAWQCPGYSGVDAYTGWTAALYIHMQEIYTVKTGTLCIQSSIQHVMNPEEFAVLSLIFDKNLATINMHFQTAACQCVMRCQCLTYNICL